MRTPLQLPAALACLLAAAAWAAPGPEAGAEPGATSCRPCHTEDRPERGRAELAKCPRVEAPAARPAGEAPAAIVMSDGRGRHGRVEFAHRAHAEMAEMGRSCAECHHEATEGRPMRRCGECHPASRLRSDSLEIPDLRGAIHRQCLDCHTLWDPEVRCASCHAAPDVPAGGGATRYAHTGADGSPLSRLHRGLACASCHERGRAAADTDPACASCHEDWPKAFDHAKTGLALDEDHAEADCKECHADTKTFAGEPTCSSCHDDKACPKDLPGRRAGDAPAGGALP
jgi:hypothetical protein